MLNSSPEIFSELGNPSYPFNMTPMLPGQITGVPWIITKIRGGGDATGSLDKSQGCHVPEMHSAVRVKEAASFLPHNLVFQWIVTGVKKAGFLQCLFIYLLIF